MSKNYLVPASFAERCGVKTYRYGNDKEGYVVNSSDIEVIPLEEVFAAGGRELTADEARGWVKKFRKQK